MPTTYLSPSYLDTKREHLYDYTMHGELYWDISGNQYLLIVQCGDLRYVQQLPERELWALPHGHLLVMGLMHEMEDELVDTVNLTVGWGHTSIWDIEVAEAYSY